ncbi:STAS domain-containing protein [Kitasatospora sp. NPDC087861]|uniref:STAS domain-containing protein n=1 Tax=Kitasatospora sp. NPDC087861 TaxID=3364070 RepID=UPI003827D5D5
MTRRPPATDPAPGPVGLTVQARPWARGTVLALYGELDLDSVDALWAALDAALAAPAAVVVIDCAGLEFCDSTGLDAMFRAQDRAAARGSRIELARPRPPVLRMLELTGATDVLPVRDVPPSGPGRPTGRE